MTKLNDLATAREEIERLKADLQKAHDGWQAEVAVIRGVADDNLTRAEKAEAEIGRLTQERDRQYDENASRITAQAKAEAERDEVRALLAALEARDREGVREGMRRAAEICNASYGGLGLGGAHRAILVEMEKLK